MTTVPLKCCCRRLNIRLSFVTGKPTIQLYNDKKNWFTGEAGAACLKTVAQNTQPSRSEAHVNTRVAM